ncbi:LysR family transcriptional regulator [Actinomadura yumaensis]|uniref:LysR family transcriptional regulator n=1 Tax=Actinomadura TaxID=1988 RepID=UPI0013712CE1
MAVAEELNFSAAARRLYVSQQALSRVIQQLEREVGVALFERTTRSVRLTPAGEAMLGWARRSAAAADEAVGAARRAADGDRPRPLRLDLSATSLRTAAKILRRLRHDHPELPVELTEDGVPRGLDALLEGRLDALLGLATHCPAELNAELICREPVLVGMGGHHELAALEAVPVARLAENDLLLPSNAAAAEWVEFVSHFCAQAGVRPRRSPAATHGSAAAADLLRMTDCLTPTTAWDAPPADLVFRPLVTPTPLFAWAVMTSPAAGERPELQAFQQSVRALSTMENWLAPLAD